MNIFVKQNWYHYDLNKQIIKNLRSPLDNSKKDNLKIRMDNDFKLKLKKA